MTPPQSTEAQLIHALNDLRRIQGTVRVLELRIGSAELLVEGARSVLEHVSGELTGDSKKEVARIERMCQDWQTSGR